ncbi:HlyD family efflux transporter periplasmic adaptor subunit [Actinoplanes friuliensis]|uniref:Peptidoglycan-binding domain 1 protein n=1 Tax=Actinoplanes friuliensis DSM 7358 TaxID=1246995 RepID=U5VNY7_9ACTN|nr:HlyD family efflux transporter periplasmic adaptor subunit [Actinoplanes friuliensis]AGZ38512.1 peptidoglycan-binding domain 1 protein [Actinoplanes friuliensis DSM 7358]
MRRVLLATGAVVALAAAGALIVTQRGTDTTTPSGTGAATGTAKVAKRDLAVTEDVKGDLGYADKRDLTAHRSGVVTYLPAEAAVVKQGKKLYSVDLEPTVLLTGKIPAYRRLSTASPDGADIEQLEKALVALGYGDDLTVDDNFTAATADAVENWEEDLKRAEPDGTVELGDVVFAPGPLRVSSRAVSVGTQVQITSPVVTVSSTSKVAEVDLEVDKSDLVAAQDAVTVSLPDGKETPGKVTSVGTDAQTSAADPDADPTVLMVVALTRPADAKNYDSGSVTVTIEQSRDDNVLAVPVTALLALAEGGYAVQVVDPARPTGYRLVGVETGTITDAYAGISGAGVQEGLEVVVPQ